MKDRKKYIGCGILAAGYVIVNLWLLYYHEPWRDEAQTWLIARDLPFWRIPAQMSYEGHPCLWHMLIYPLVHLGLPYPAQSILAFVLAGAAVFLLLFRSGLPFYVKAAAVFSPMLTYYCSVIARNYCLIPILLFLLADWYPSRFERPWRYTCMVALLLQSHAIMAVTAFSLSMCFFVEITWRFFHDRRRDVCIRNMSALLLPFGSAVFLLYELLHVGRSSAMHIGTASLRRTAEKMLEVTAEGIGAVCGMAGRAGLLVFLAGAVLLAGMLIRRRGGAKYTVAVTVVLTWAFQSWFYAMVYAFSMQRLLTMPQLLLWGMWVLTAEENREGKRKGSGRRKIAEPVFCLFCLMAIYHTFPEIMRDVREPYSNGKEAAAFIKEEIPEYSIILTDNQAEVSAIFPYLDRRDYIYAPNVTHFTFVTWDEHWRDRTDYDTFLAWLDIADTGEIPVYLISSMNQSNIDGSERLPEDFTLLYQSSYASLKGEDYRIFRIR